MVAPEASNFACASIALIYEPSVLSPAVKCTNDFVGLMIQDESQGSISGDHIGLQFTTGADAPATGARDYCMEVTAADSSGWDAFAHFYAGDMTDGSRISGGSIAAGTSDGIIKVVIGSTDYYIPVFAAGNVTGEW